MLGNLLVLGKEGQVVTLTWVDMMQLLLSHWALLISKDLRWANESGRKRKHSGQTAPYHYYLFTQEDRLIQGDLWEGMLWIGVVLPK